MIESLFLCNSGVTGKLGWYNKVTMTTLKTINYNVFAFVFKKMVVRFPEISVKEGFELVFTKNKSNTSCSSLENQDENAIC